LKEVPFDIRDEAMCDLLKAFGSNFAKKKLDPKKTFTVRFKSRKAPTQSLVIHSKHWKDGRMYPKSFGAEPLRATEPIPASLGYDSRLIRTRLGEFYLCIPMPLQVRRENQAPLWTGEEDGVVALDPGVRTFMTGYTSTGVGFEWGKADIGRIYRLCYAYDKLQGKVSKETVKKKRYRMRRALMRIAKKTRDLVDDCHRKFAKWLCLRFRVVLLPEFETSRMVQRAQSKIGSKTARAMLRWSHYRFRQRLLFKAQEYPWCTVDVVTEEFTSKTCGACGFLHQKLGSSKTFKCPSCGVEMDRDSNAARNILLKYLTQEVEPRAGSFRGTRVVAYHLGGDPPMQGPEQECSEMDRNVQVQL
jgi:putative transposase